MATAEKTVLLVDDDENIVEPLRLALENHGYRVLIANDGAEALMRAERDEPDLILLDIVMPRRSGFAVLNRLKEGRVHQPRIIMMTANTEKEHRDYAEAQGVDAYVNKPFEMDAMLDRVDALLAASSE